MNRRVFLKSLIVALVFLLLSIAPAEAYKFASGTYTGNGSDNRTIDISATTTPSVADFQPNVCIVKGDTTQRAVIRISSMPIDTGQELFNQAAANNYIQDFNANGFQVGSDARVNSNTVTYYYMCLGTDSNNDLAVGTYTGTGGNNVSITTSPAFQPALVMIVRADANGRASWRGENSHTGDSTSKTHGTANSAGIIDQFNSDGFRVDNITEANSSGVAYYYFSIKTGMTSSVQTGTYTGNATDDRTISVGFQPQFAWIKTNSVNGSLRMRFKDNVGDSSCTVNSTSGCATNSIQQFNTNDMQVGTDVTVNENSVTQHWFAIREQAAVALFGPIRRRFQ